LHRRSIGSGTVIGGDPPDLGSVSNATGTSQRGGFGK
jgi:hypothetical protein